MPTVPAGSKLEAEMLAIAEHRGAVVGGAMAQPDVPPLQAPVFKSESEFQAAVVEEAKKKGWLEYHTYRSWNCNPGFPDLILIRRDRLIAAELKKSKKEKPTPAQRKWLRAFQGVTGVSVFIWCPDDWDWILKELS